MTTEYILKPIVDDAIETFRDNALCRKVDEGQFKLEDYHAILHMIFHQTFETSTTFALAGANCSATHQPVKEYLFHHADEEKGHWKWVLDDLRNTGYQGKDPRELHPRPACQAYIAFNYYTALRMPVGRLAIAAVLEGIGARYGNEYAAEICRQLRLKPEQASFFLRHGETDKEHVKDLWEMIDGCDLKPAEWAWMGHAARTAGAFYKAMYDEAAK